MTSWAGEPIRKGFGSRRTTKVWPSLATNQPRSGVAEGSSVRRMSASAPGDQFAAVPATEEQPGRRVDARVRVVGVDQGRLLGHHPPSGADGIRVGLGQRHEEGLTLVWRDLAKGPGEPGEGHGRRELGSGQGVDQTCPEPGIFTMEQEGAEDLGLSQRSEGDGGLGLSIGQGLGGGLVGRVGRGLGHHGPEGVHGRLRVLEPLAELPGQHGRGVGRAWTIAIARPTGSWSRAWTSPRPLGGVRPLGRLPVPVAAGRLQRPGDLRQGRAEQVDPERDRPTLLPEQGQGHRRRHLAEFEPVGRLEPGERGGEPELGGRRSIRRGAWPGAGRPGRAPAGRDRLDDERDLLGRGVREPGEERVGPDGGGVGEVGGRAAARRSRSGRVGSAASRQTICRENRGSSRRTSGIIAFRPGKSAFRALCIRSFARSCSRFSRIANQVPAAMRPRASPGRGGAGSRPPSSSARRPTIGRAGSRSGC